MKRISLLVTLFVLMILPAGMGQADDDEKVYVPQVHNGRYVRRMLVEPPKPTLAPDCPRDQQTPVAGDGWTGYVCPGWATPTPRPTTVVGPTRTPVAYPAP